MARWATQWFLSLQITLYLFLIFVQGNEDADEAYKNGRNLALEFFLPINLPAAVNVPMRREKRDVEGSGEDEGVFSELNEKHVEDADNATQNAFAKLFLDEEHKKVSSEVNVEGSGEVEVTESSEVSSEEDNNESNIAPLILDNDHLTTTVSDELVGTTENPSEESSTKTVFDNSEDEKSTIKTEETTTEANKPTPSVLIITSTEELETTTLKTLSEENTTEFVEVDKTTPTLEETTIFKAQDIAFHTEETTAMPSTEATTVVPDVIVEGDILQHVNESSAETEAPAATSEETKETTAPIIIPIIVGHEEHATKTDHSTTPPTKSQEVLSTADFLPSVPIPKATEGLPTSESTPTTPKPIVEEVFKETKVHNTLEAMPGNILQKENLSLAADHLLITNTRLMDSEENVQLSSAEPKRLGAYIVIGLILLSFSSLVGYITFRKRMNRKRQKFESNQESNDTEKALLSLSDYKDNSELEENHLKNNEITPIVVKSNSQINKFEKNTNFSSPKNLNTIANEKNIEKDNVLKSTAENLTQVIIEDSPKDVEEDKNVPNMEKLIVKTRIDQDSIPKKPIIINRSSTGYMPIPQDNA